MMVVGEAAQKAGGDRRRSARRSRPASGPGSWARWSSRTTTGFTNQNKLVMPVIQYQGGKSVTVYPKQFAKKKAVFPFPAGSRSRAAVRREPRLACEALGAAGRRGPAARSFCSVPVTPCAPVAHFPVRHRRQALKSARVWVARRSVPALTLVRSIAEPAE